MPEHPTRKVPKDTRRDSERRTYRWLRTGAFVRAHGLKALLVLALAGLLAARCAMRGLP